MTTLARLQELLARDFELKLESLDGQATLESMAIDSLRMIEILFSVEDEFKITMPSEQAQIREKVKTLGDLAGYIDALAAEQGKAAT